MYLGIKNRDAHICMGSFNVQKYRVAKYIHILAHSKYYIAQYTWCMYFCAQKLVIFFICILFLWTRWIGLCIEIAKYSFQLHVTRFFKNRFDNGNAHTLVHNIYIRWWICAPIYNFSWWCMRTYVALRVG